MNRLSSILMLALVLLHLAAPAWMQGLFVVNQTAIEEAHCVNKARPELACHGQCFLTRQLAGGLASESIENPEQLQLRLPLWPLFWSEHRDWQAERLRQTLPGPILST